MVLLLFGLRVISLISPCEWIGDMFNVRTQVAVDFGPQVRGFGGSECRKIIKYVELVRLD